METLICPVSTQILPNIVVSLHLRPKTVVLLSTKEMKKFANYHKNVLSIKGIDVKEIEIDPYNEENLKNTLKIKNTDTLLLNCGTKFTAITLYKMANDVGAKTIYYLPNGRIIDFNGNEVSIVPEDLIDVQTHAEIYGFKIIGEVQDIEEIRIRKPLTEFIARNYQNLSAFLKKLYHNGYLSDVPSELRNLLKKFEIAEEKRGKIFVTNRNYIGGKWLEEFTFLNLLNRNFYDVKIGVKVSWRNFKNITNEIDVVAIKENLLHLFSCKTGDNLTEIKKHLYELEELTEQIGGDFGKSYLVVTPDVFSLKRPNRSQFPNMPHVNFYRGKHEWYKYYKTQEGKAYRKAYGKFAASKNVLSRAKLLGVKVINLNNFKEENFD